MTNREKIVDALGGLLYNCRIALTPENHELIKCWCCGSSEEALCMERVNGKLELVESEDEDARCAECKTRWLNRQAEKEGRQNGE